MHQLRLDDLGTPLIDTTFVVLDLETTGLDPARDRITEVGAVRVRGGEVLGELRTFVHPGRPIPPAVTAVTGITDAMVAHAPSEAAVLGHVLSFLDGAVLVAHNAAFDLSFLRSAAARCATPEPTPVVLDTARLSRRLLRDEVRDHRLATLARHLRARTAPAHRALADARATVDVLHGLLERAGGLGATTVEDVLELTRVRSDRTFRRRSLVADAPRTCGVYRFLDEDGRTLYVGKATDLQARLRTYFGQDPRRRIADMVRATERVTWRPTPTLLEAEVLELRTILAEQPRFNRRARTPVPDRWLAVTREPFPRLSVVSAPGRGHLAAIGPLPGRRTTERLKEAIEEALPVRACTIRLRTAQDHPACVLKELQRCGAPCDGSQDRADYAQLIEQVTGLLDDPAPVLRRLEARMHALAERGRYERAGALRELRAGAARTLQGRRDAAWLLEPAALVLERRLGSAVETVWLQHGRVRATARGGPEGRSLPAHPTLVPSPEAAGDDAGIEVEGGDAGIDTAPVRASHAELDLVLRWAGQGTVRLVETSTPLSSPLAGGRELAEVLAEARRTDRQVRRDRQQLTGQKVRRRSGDGSAVVELPVGREQVDGAVGSEAAEDEELAAEPGDAPRAEVEGPHDLPADELLGGVVGDPRARPLRPDDRTEVDRELQRRRAGLGEGLGRAHGPDA